jgi:hypothetical protein
MNLCHFRGPYLKPGSLPPLQFPSHPLQQFLKPLPLLSVSPTVTLPEILVARLSYFCKHGISLLKGFSLTSIGSLPLVTLLFGHFLSALSPGQTPSCLLGLLLLFLTLGSCLSQTSTSFLHSYSLYVFCDIQIPGTLLYNLITILGSLLPA